MPTKCWQAKTPQEMHVRMRFVPRKHSSQPGGACVRSSATVDSIAASLVLISVFLPYSCCNEALASSTRPLRTRYQGDSGAKGSPTARKRTKKNCIIKGPLYAQRSIRAPKPLMAELERSWPSAIPRFTPAVAMPRRTTGVIWLTVSVPVPYHILRASATDLRAAQWSECQVESQTKTKDELANQESWSGDGKHFS